MPFYHHTLPAFPTYLLPSLPFSSHRRRISTSSAHSRDSDDAAPSLSPSPPTSPRSTGFLDAALWKHEDPPPRKPERLSRAQPNTLKCVTCAADIAFISQIVSKGFTGRYGRAYLVAPPPKRITSDGKRADSTSSSLPNIRQGRPVFRDLLTGAHVVADVTCVSCQTVLGWKYLEAKEPAQKYKIGKYILETQRVVATVSWEDGEEPLDEVEPADADKHDEGLVIFDEEDEDECDDLFAGTWNPVAVAESRARRVNTRITDANS
jgi:hypothetical protein